MADRDPITCHVLNTFNGTPAAGVSCTLTLVDVHVPSPVNSSRAPNQPPSFHAVTDADGRVKCWQPLNPSPQSANSLRTVFESLPNRVESDGSPTRSTWSLRLSDVGKWYQKQGVESFWSDITVQFVVCGKEGEPGWRHYHVPVLLGPWNYSTYRGS
ncbi:hypothetical protein VTO42DRAFT_5342 [Malbranchea cinnamomea]